MEAKLAEKLCPIMEVIWYRPIAQDTALKKVPRSQNFLT